MKNIKLVDNLDFIYGLKPLEEGIGGLANCYYYDSKTVIKCYINPAETSFFKDDIESTLGVKNNTYIYPHTMLVNQNGNLLATLSDYIEGRNLDCLRKNVLITDFHNAIDKVAEDTLELSKQHIITDDVSASNMIYTPGLIRIIDSDFHSKVPALGDDECFKLDMENANLALLSYFTETGNIFHDDIIQSFIVRNELLYELFSSLCMNLHDYRLLKEFILNMACKVEEEKQADILTIEDMQKVLIRER